MPRSYNWEDLLDSSSVCEETIFLNGIEIQSGVSLLEKVVGVFRLAKNCCDRGTGWFGNPEERGMSATGSCYQDY
jgi:hypothetical protein